MTAPTFLAEWWDAFTDWLLADDETRAFRFAGLFIVAVIVWRALILAAQAKPAPAPRNPLSPAEAVSPTPATPRRAWWPSRQEKIEAAIELVRKETDLLLSKADEVNASAGLAKARADLSALMRELAPEPVKKSAHETTTALSLSEIENCLVLVELEPQLRAQLLSLFTACIAEKQS
jgi:hypothetical protein